MKKGILKFIFNFSIPFLCYNAKEQGEKIYKK